MVEAGETGGILDTILQRLSTYIEKNVKLKRAVKSALIYPIGVLSHRRRRHHVAVVEGRSDFRNVVCRLGRGPAAAYPNRDRLEQLRGQHLRLPDFRGLIAAMFGLKIWYGTPGGRFVIDTIVLKLPVLGILMRKIAVARFTRTLGTLIASGVPILEGLDITAQDFRQRGGRAGALNRSRKSLEEGKSLTEPLKESEVFPGHGDADDRRRRTDRRHGRHACRRSRTFTRTKWTSAVKDLLTALEPIMIVFLGLVVGGVVISMYLPLFSLIGKLSNSH